jgi:hypothetical protein
MGYGDNRRTPKMRARKRQEKKKNREKRRIDEAKAEKSKQGS